MHRFVSYRSPLATVLTGLFYIALGLWLWWAFKPWLRD